MRHPPTRDRVAPSYRALLVPIVSLSTLLSVAAPGAGELVGGSFRLHAHSQGVVDAEAGPYRLQAAAGQPVATGTDARGPALRLRAGLFVGGTGDRIFHDGFEDPQ